MNCGVLMLTYFVEYCNIYDKTDKENIYKT